MKKKILLILLIVILMSGSFVIGRQVGLNTEESKTSIVTRQEDVISYDIKKTLTSSGQVQSKTTEKLELNTYRYFEAMCVEDDDTVKAGENLLEYTNGTYLTVPYDCVIISHSVPETGNKCTDSNYIEISNLNTLVTTISINENEINSIALDQAVEITLTADEKKTYTGKVTKIDSVGTYASSGTTFSSTIEFENDGNVKLGMNVSCTLILKEEKQVTCVPIDAVLENSEGKEYVNKVKEDGTIEETIVETGIADENYVQILSGLELNEKVQIETEITESSPNNSGNSQTDKRNSGNRGMMGYGQMPQGMEKGQMPQMPQGGMPSGTRGGN